MRRLQVDLCLSTDEAIGTVLANAVPETTDVLLHVEVDQASSPAPTSPPFWAPSARSERASDADRTLPMSKEWKTNKYRRS